MPNEFEGARTRRRYERITGPFDAVVDDGPVLIYDLNVGGCFVNASRQPDNGSIASLRINLLQEGWISVNAEALYRHDHGFAARFLDLDADAASRIGRLVAAHKNRGF